MFLNALRQGSHFVIQLLQYDDLSGGPIQTKYQEALSLVKCVPQGLVMDKVMDAKSSILFLAKLLAAKSGSGNHSKVVPQDWF